MVSDKKNKCFYNLESYAMMQPEHIRQITLDAFSSQKQRLDDGKLQIAKVKRLIYRLIADKNQMKS